MPTSRFRQESRGKVSFIYYSEMDVNIKLYSEILWHQNSIDSASSTDYHQGRSLPIILCTQFNCGDVVDAYAKKMEHLQIA